MTRAAGSSAGSAVREFLLPDLGEGLTEAEIISWRVAVGDVVTVDQVVVEVETAKAAVEVPCPYGGVVVALHGAVGDVVDVGKPLIAVDNRPQVGEGEAPEEPADRARLDAAKKESGGSGNVLIGYGTPAVDGAAKRRRRVVSGFGGHDAPVVSRPSHSSASQGSSSQGSASQGSASRDGSDSPANVGYGPRTTAISPDSPAEGRIEANGRAGGRIGASTQRVAVVSPLVRRLARESDLDLASVSGTGPNGLIMRRDVEAALTSSAPAAASPAAASALTSAESERIPLRGLRKVVADKLARSRREIPDATTWVDVDATGLVQTRDLLNASPGAQRLGLLALLARICVAGLARYPELNATVDVERQEIVRLRDVNLGFAAQTDRGLVVPVVHGANRMTAEQLAVEIERLTAAARTGTLNVADLTGSTFTLNNYGVYGVDGSTPIINHPEAAMLGVGRIVKKPWVVEGPDGDELAIRRVTQLSFTFDHRVCDGGVAGGFLRYVADLVEEPSRLLRAV